MPAIPVKGLFETHLTVSDLDRSIAFYRDIAGLTLAHRVPERHAALMWVGAPGGAMLGLWSIHSSPMQMRLHAAFAVTMDDLMAAPARLRAAGIAPRHGDEPVVIGWMPAASVFFDDPDGHSLELICMLDETPRPELSWVPLSEWRTAR
jgi:lactoylglutathione lyase